MPASKCYFRLNTIGRKLLGFFAVSLTVASLVACGGGRLTTDRAYGELKPKKQLPQRELRNLPENLFIKIENVADAGKSYRNFVTLYVNGREVAPVERVSNFTSSYTYPLRVQHGLYEIKAEYHVVGSWREQVFDIVPDEPVKVMPDHRTTLHARIDKDGRGRPVQKPVRFRLNYEKTSIETDETPADRELSSQGVIIQPVPPVRSLSEAPPPVRQRPSARQYQPPRTIEPIPPPADLPDAVGGEHTLLQINTSPSGADVIVDDRYYGQSPIRISVSKDQNHVLQISRKGYKEIVKMLDAADLQHETLVQLLVKLEAAEDSRQD